MNKSIQHNVWRNPIHFFAFGFGSGLSPIAPGTCGTAAAIPLYLLMRPLPLVYYLALVAVFILLGFWICGVAARDVGIPDYKGIVWDEIVGYLLTMIAAPSGWLWILVGFGLFRLFDVLKPWPIHWPDRHLQGGVGIVLDDLLAGAYAWMVLRWFIWLWVTYA